MLDDFEPKLRELLAQGQAEQCVELCRALNEEAVLLSCIAETPAVVQGARALLEVLCPDTLTARRTERLWACACLSSRLPALADAGAQERAQRYLRLALQIGRGTCEPVDDPEPPGLQNIPPRFRAQFRQRMAQTMQSLGGVEGMAQRLTRERFSGAQIAVEIQYALTRRPAALAVQERDQAAQLSRAARYGALGPRAQQLRAHAARATEQAALAEVHARMGRHSPSSSHNPQRIQAAECAQQARLLAEHCTPYLLPIVAQDDR